jgi:hypothetical protein
MPRETSRRNLGRSHALQNASETACTGLKGPERQGHMLEQKEVTIAMKHLPLLAASFPFLLFGLGGIAAAQSQPHVIDDSQMKALSTTIGGANPLPTTRTVQHWFGSTLDPHNGVTYGYNMVGSDPNTCTGSACSATVTADIIPLNVVVEGETFSGEDVVAPTLVSPVFALNDYGSTPFATAAGAFPNLPAFIRGPGGRPLPG